MNIFMITTQFFKIGLAAAIFSVAASRMSAAEYADFDSPGSWRISSPGSEQTIEWITDYSPRLRVVKVTVVPLKQWYAEISPKKLPEIAKSPEDLNFKVSWEFLCDTPEIMTQVAVRLMDATGEVFQFQKKISPRSGQWQKAEIILAPDSPRSSWGGNNDKKLDYPLKFHSIILDGQKNGISKVSYYIHNLKVEKNK